MTTADTVADVLLEVEGAPAEQVLAAAAQALRRAHRPRFIARP